MYNNYNTLYSDCQSAQDEKTTMAVNKTLLTLAELQRRKEQQIQLYNTIVRATMENNNQISISSLQNILHCGENIRINNDGKIVAANFCHNRFCPICQWRNSRKQFGRLIKLQNKAVSDNYKFILITLTIKNTKDLQRAITDILQGFKRLQDNRRFKRAIRGFIRAFEVTYNSDTQEYHPHVHLLCAINNEYYTDEKQYIEHSNLIQIWQSCMNLDYAPDVDIRPVRHTEKAIAEVSKYVVKPIDIDVNTDDNILYYLVRTMYKRRLHSISGIYRQYAKELKMSLNSDVVADLTDTTVQSHDDILFIYDEQKHKFVGTEM